MSSCSPELLYSIAMKQTTITPKFVPTNYNAYSKATQMATREGLEALHVHLFMHESRCHLKRNSKLEGSGFGFITLENALAHKLLVENKKSGPAILYATVDDLVNDGWVVD